MADDFLSRFLGNAARARILRAFVLNQSEVFTAPLAAKRAGVSPATAAKEIRSLEQLGVIKKEKFSVQEGKAKRAVTGRQNEHAWAFDPDFKHAPALVKFVHEVSPVQYKNILGALKGAGRLAAIILSGSFMGDPTRPADLIVAADALNEGRLESAVKALEPAFGREIRYAVFSTPEFRYRLTIEDRLLRDTLDYPHLVLLDKMRLL